MSGAWLLYGGLILALPWLTSAPLINIAPHFNDPSWSGWWGLLPTFLAGIVGAAMSCLWFGWYLGVCSILNGHNNEIGGAARVERFKEFIRFRLSEEGLTGYVIGVEDVSMIGKPAEPGKVYDGRDLRPKLIDVFHLKVKT